MASRIPAVETPGTARGRRAAAARAVLGAALALTITAAPAAALTPPGSIHYVKAADLDGNPVDLAAYDGKVLLVVNVASFCGYTAQYGGLEKLHREFGPRGFSVLGFPSNDFGGQEPGSPAEIRKFVTEKYGVTFPLFAKSVLRPGPDQSPVYAFLGRSAGLPQWNFGKYLVGKNGQVIALFGSDVTPESAQLREAIEKALAEQ